jgi:cbb3-type cytochrome oxidase maturation protein
MEVLYLLIPLALILVALVVWALLWSIRTGQFDDMEGPAHRILMDDDDSPSREAGKQAGPGSVVSPKPEEPDPRLPPGQ